MLLNFGSNMNGITAAFWKLKESRIQKQLIRKTNDQLKKILYTPKKAF